MCNITLVFQNQSKYNVSSSSLMLLKEMILASAKDNKLTRLPLEISFLFIYLGTLINLSV